MRPAAQFDLARQLIASGMNDCAIARELNIPRGTIRDWRTRQQKWRRPTVEAPCGVVHDFDKLPPRAYAYLLGLNLGDGCISRMGRVYRLRITLDIKYPSIIAACRQAIDTLMPGQRAAVQDRETACVEVNQYSKHWPCLFPQHGPGRKHFRRIALEPWQQAIVDVATEDFIRGLIDSDGCRAVANDRGVRSIRYHFSNRSEDILGIFTAALDHLGIPWTRNTRYGIAVYRKAATARMDTFVGAKSDPRPLLTC